MSTEISERGRGLVRQLGIAHIEFQYGSVQRGDVESARDTLLAYIAALESVAHASQSAIDACGDPVCSTCAPMIAALAALDAVKP